MIFVLVWTLGAIIMFFWSYPGGLTEMKRDWIYHKGNLGVYSLGMFLLWFLMLLWMLDRSHRIKIQNSHTPHLREVR